MRIKKSELAIMLVLTFSLPIEFSRAEESQGILERFSEAFSSASNKTDSFTQIASPSPTMPKSDDSPLNHLLLADYLSSSESYPADGVVLGQGWYRGLGKKSMNRCVTGISIPIEGGSATSTFREIYDREELATALKISASGSYGSSFSASANYSKETSLIKTKRNILAQIDVDKGGTQLAPAAPLDSDDPRERLFPKYQLKFTPEALVILQSPTDSAPAKLKKFKALCGDSFISTIRNGGKYVAKFQLNKIDSSTKESFDASAGGSYGGFGGSGSISKSVYNAKDSSDTSIDSYQLGGELTTPTNAAEAYAKISNFATFSNDKSAPYSITVMPYQAISQWPQDLNKASVSDRYLKHLVGQMWRLDELAGIYNDAALNSARYYFPFQEVSVDAKDKKEAIQQQLIKSAAKLKKASYCISGFVAACALYGDCEESTALNFCPSFKELKEEGALDVLALAFPIRTLEAGKIQKKISENDIEEIMKSANIEYKSSNTTVIKSPSTYAGDPYSLYYKYLARAPLARIGGENPNDEAFQIFLYCKISSATKIDDCDIVAPQNMTFDDNEAAKKIYSRWITSYRLGLISTSFCSTDAYHPMCRDVAELITIGNEVNSSFGQDRNYIATPPISQPRPEKTPIYRPERPCPGHTMNCI